MQTEREGGSGRGAAGRTGADGASRHGSALGVVLIVLAVLSVLGVSMLNLATVDTVETSRSLSSNQAFWLAEAGLQQAKAIAYRNRQPFDIVGILGQNVLSVNTADGSYSVDIEDDPAWVNSGNSLKRYVITSRGTSRGGASRIVAMHAEIQTFANYMHASNYERTSDGTPIYFGPDDYIDGPVYCNDELNVYGGARILGLTKSAASSVNYRSGGNASTFEGGLVLNAPALDFEGIYSEDHITAIRDQAQNGGLVLSGDADLTFNRDGTVTYPYGRWGRTRTVALSTLNGAIYVGGDVTVQGVVNGSVTVAAESGIRIPDDGIVYAGASGTSPSPFGWSFNPENVHDSLGLVARNSVTLTGTHSVDVHAAILVTGDGDGFSASHRYDRIGNPAINLYGSVSQYRRGIVGRTGGDGFHKNYKYDSRLLESAPPHYPYSAYAFTRWEQVR